jgi:hypothetical protein
MVHSNLLRAQINDYVLSYIRHSALGLPFAPTLKHHQLLNFSSERESGPALVQSGESTFYRRPYATQEGPVGVKGTPVGLPGTCFGLFGPRTHKTPRNQLPTPARPSDLGVGQPKPGIKLLPERPPCFLAGKKGMSWVKAAALKQHVSAVASAGCSGEDLEPMRSVRRVRCA